MAPGYRNQNRRQNRTGYVDHDVFEGLPVRHWRRDYVTVAPPPSIETSTSLNDIWGVELPHGMPKDYHLLPQHSQDLLRGARSGRIYKRPTPVEEDEVDVEGVVAEKPEKKEEETKDRGFAAKAWKQVPRHLEGPDVEYLAKRKKNVITIGSKAPKVIPTVTKATMKRIDAAGNEYVQDVIVPHGQQIEGEIISQTEIPDPAAMGVEGFAVQPTPSKKRPANKKKHKAGPGRGRKKKMTAPTSAPAIIGSTTEVKPAEAVDANGIKIENDGSVPPNQSEDTEMRDGSAAASDNDDSDEGDDDGDDDEGSVASGSPAKRVKLDSDVTPPALPTMEAIPDLPPIDSPLQDSTTTEPLSQHPVRPFLHLDERTKSGSPLKNVALSNSALASPLEAPESEVLPAPITETAVEQVPDLDLVQAKDKSQELEEAQEPVKSHESDSAQQPDEMQGIETVQELETVPETVLEAVQEAEAVPDLQAVPESEALPVLEAVPEPEPETVQELNKAQSPENAQELEKPQELDNAEVIETNQEPEQVQEIVTLQEPDHPQEVAKLVEPAQVPEAAKLEDLDTEMQKETEELALAPIPTPPPAPTAEVVESAVTALQEEKEEDAMLLDIVEKIDAQVPEKIAEPLVESPPAPAPTPAIESVKEDVAAAVPEAETADIVPPTAEKAAEGEEEPFSDLLGDLEKSLVAKPKED